MAYKCHDGYNERICFATAKLWVRFEDQTETVVIPSTGGVVNYTLNVGNYTESSKSGDMWVVMIHPDGTRELIRQVGGLANTCDLLTFSYAESISPIHDEGVYTLEANIGNYPNSIMQDTLKFIKSPCY